MIQDHDVKANNLQAQLLDKIRTAFKLKNDLALSRFLETSPSSLSRFRNMKLPICAAVIIRIHEATGWPVRLIRDALGHGPEMYSDRHDRKPRQQTDEQSK